MDIDNLIKIRNCLNTLDGKLIITYLGDYITSKACMDKNPSEIKGMCELLEYLKRVTDKVERLRNRK